MLTEEILFLDLMKEDLFWMTNELFVDTDCISSFLWVRKMNIIQELYGGRIIIPDPVYQELSHPSVRFMKIKVDGLISNKDAKIKTIDYDTEEYRLYNSMIKSKDRKIIGKGEAGAIALAKVYDGILVSNNYKDIKDYIEEYNLRHLDTGQILLEALRKNIITEDEGNEIWSKMLSKGIFLPKKTFTEYKKTSCIYVTVLL